MGSNLGEGPYLGSTSKERMGSSEQMLPLSKARRINRITFCSIVKRQGCCFSICSGCSWVMPATVKEMLSGWKGTLVGKKRKGVWRASPLCLFWTVWKARKKVAFEEEELSIQRLSLLLFIFFGQRRSCL